jgi:hypothetical protein
LGDSIPPIILLVETPFGRAMLEEYCCFVLNIGKELAVMLDFGVDVNEFSFESMFGYRALAIPHASTTEKG